MAQISLSPLVVDIRNKVADMVFSKWKGVNYVRSRVVPSNPQTAAQTNVRDALAEMVSLWGEVGTAVKLNNNYWATGKNLSGFNRFVGRNVVARAAEDRINLTNDYEYEPITGFAAATGSGSGEIDISWTSGAVPAGHSMPYYVIKENELSFFIVSSYPAATASPQTITSLNPGATYRVYALNTKAATPNGYEVGKDVESEAAAQS